MKKQRILCPVFLTLACMAASALSACGDSSSPVQTEPAVTSSVPATEQTTADTSPKLSLPDKTFSGADVTILTLTEYNDRFKLNVDDDGETLNAAARKRNLAVEERLDIHLAVVERDDAAQTLKQSVMADEHLYDFVFPHATVGVAAMVTDRLLLDWNTLPYADLSNPWWNTHMTESLGIGGKLCYASGDIVMAWQGMGAVLFNKTYLSGTDMTDDDLYQMVFDGKWTIDAMRTLSAGHAKDLDGDGKWTTADQYGLLDNDGAGYLYMYSCGQRVTTPDADGYPVLTLNTPRMTDIVSKYYELVHAPDTFLDAYWNSTYPTSTYRTMLLEGRSFLTTLDIGGLYPYLREITFDFGILPPPKLDEAQEDYQIFCGAGLIGIPQNIADPERAGMTAEAMAYESYRTIRPAFFDIVLENKSVRDENSYRVIKMMHERKVFDFGFNFDATGTAYNMLGNVVIQKNSTDFASYYAKNELKIQKGFQKILDACKEEP